MKIKKNTLGLIIAGALILFCIIIILFKEGVFTAAKDKMPDVDAMALEDTSRVTKLFIADMHGNSVLLQKKDNRWVVGDSLPALQYNVKSVLGTLCNIAIRQTVPQDAQSNVNKLLAVGAVKVEVYEIAPKFSFFGLKFFEKERKTKTYYFGPATQDNLASYAFMEGLPEPYIIHVPGFRGFITPQFSQFEKDWVSHVLFHTKITRIQSVQFQDIENQNESFSIEKCGPRHFNLFDAANHQLESYDTLKVIDMLSEFREKNYQSLVTDLTPAQQDSIINGGPFRIITLTDINGEKTELFFYRIPEEYQILSEEGDLVSEIQRDFSRDKFYARLASKPDELYIVQYFHFDRQLQPLSYFK